MSFCRRNGLTRVVVCLCAAGVVPAWMQGSQTPPAPPPSGQTKPAPAPPAKPPSPFETVPEAPAQQAPQPAQPAAPQRPGLEAPKPAEPAQPHAEGQVIEAIEFRGARRVPQDTLKALIYSKRGDILNEEALRRDFMALWNTGRFDDIRLETEPGRTGLIVRFVLVERRVVRSIKYEGMKSITVSEILDRFKERKVGLSVESQYDPNKIQRAAIVLKEYLSERGRQFATVEPDIRQIPPSSLEVTFNVKEGPKVKVGEIEIAGNNVFGGRCGDRRAMKNLRPIGDSTHSLVLENIFAKTYDSTKLEEDKDRVRDFYQQNGYFSARRCWTTRSPCAIRGRLTASSLPLFKPNKSGQARGHGDLPLEEGRQYRLDRINFVGVKLFRTPETLMRPLFQMGEGDVFSTAKLRKGLEQHAQALRRIRLHRFRSRALLRHHSQFGQDRPHADGGRRQAILRAAPRFFRQHHHARQGDPPRVAPRRRRDVQHAPVGDEHPAPQPARLLRAAEGNEAADIKRNTQTNTVDITLKVKERGKNSIGLNGGVSGIAGSFMGFNYSTNNFLGLGETLSAWIRKSATRIRNVTAGLHRAVLPGQVPFRPGSPPSTCTRYNFDYGREDVDSHVGRDNQIPLYELAGQGQPAQLCAERATASRRSSSYPLRRSFAPVSGFTYGYDISNIKTLVEQSGANRNYFRIHQLPESGLGRTHFVERHPDQPRDSVLHLQHYRPPHYALSAASSIFFSMSVRRQYSRREREH